MALVYIVQIKDARTETVETVRAFTYRIDAVAFIAECERVEKSAWYGYRIIAVELDGPCDGTY